MKRPLSLLEVVIALALTTILLTTLFSSYRHLVQSKATIETAHNEHHWKYLTQIRLNQIFETIEEGSVFYSDGATLYFKFDNGLDPDPKYCGILTGALALVGDKVTFKFMDKNEVFCQNVSYFHAQFFDTDKKKWIDGWMGKAIPSLIKLTIDEEAFTFNVPQALTPARYS